MEASKAEAVENLVEPQRTLARGQRGLQTQATSATSKTTARRERFGRGRAVRSVPLGRLVAAVKRMAGLVSSTGGDSPATSSQEQRDDWLMARGA